MAGVPVGIFSRKHTRGFNMESTAAGTVYLLAKL